MFRTFGIMKHPVLYVTNSKGKVLAVQVAMEDWNELLEKVRHYEQLLKLRSTLSTALSQVARMRSGKLKKRTIKDVLITDPAQLAPPTRTGSSARS